MGNKLVWSDELGDLRKSKSPSSNEEVNESSLVLEIMRMTSGKGRTILQISSLPNNKKWCQALAKKIKKKLATGGSYKEGLIEIHGEKFEELSQFLDSQQLKWKKIGG